MTTARTHLQASTERPPKDRYVSVHTCIIDEQVFIICIVLYWSLIDVTAMVSQLCSVAGFTLRRHVAWERPVGLNPIRGRLKNWV